MFFRLENCLFWILNQRKELKMVMCLLDIYFVWWLEINGLYFRIYVRKFYYPAVWENLLYYDDNKNNFVDRIKYSVHPHTFWAFYSIHRQFYRRKFVLGTGDFIKLENVSIVFIFDINLQYRSITQLFCFFLTIQLLTFNVHTTSEYLFASITKMKEKCEVEELLFLYRRNNSTQKLNIFVIIVLYYSWKPRRYR